MATNISSLRFLNLDKNDLTAIPVVTHSLAELQTLSLNDNPITSLSNTSLLGIAEHLSELDIANLDLTVFEVRNYIIVLILSHLRSNIFLEWSFGPHELAADFEAQHLRFHP